MNISTSEYSSGCESGWTTYLDQLSNCTDPHSRGLYTNCEGKGTRVSVNEEEEEDEDLSMVSDASSGPAPHFHEYENNAHYYGYTASVSQDKNINYKQQQKSKTKEPRPQKQHNLCLDDTASSPIYNFSLGNVPTYDNHNSVEVYPSAHFQGESKAKKHLSFFKSSTKGKSGSLLGRKRQ